MCNALGYSNSRKAIADHTDAEERCNISLQRGGEMTFINESGLKSLTEKAAGFGENQINPSNPKETQPLYYADKFEDLLKQLEIVFS